MVEDKNKNDSDIGMEFREDRVEHSYYPETPKIIQWLIKSSGGLIKDEKRASYVLIGLVALTVIIAIIIAVSSGPAQSIPGEVPAGQFVP